MSIAAIRLVSSELSLGRHFRGRRAYEIDVTDPDDTVALDLSPTGPGPDVVPALGAAWTPAEGETPAHPARAVEKTARSVDDALTYEIVVEYSSEPTAIAQTESDPDPLERPTDYSYQDSLVVEPYFRDTNGDPVVNSAGQDFGELPSRDRVEGTIVISRNVAAFDDGAAEARRNKVNSAAVTIRGTTYATGTLKVQSWSATGPHVENDVTFWRETITIAKSAAGWKHALEDRGLDELDGGKLKPILDTNDTPVQQPYPLNGSGAAQSSATTAPAVLEFIPYETADFGGWNL